MWDLAITLDIDSNSLLDSSPGGSSNVWLWESGIGVLWESGTFMLIE